MSTKRLVAAGILLVAALASCTGNDAAIEPSPIPRDSIDISEVQVALPDGHGKEQVELSCMPCHSLRYIEMQPDMPKKSWEKIVTKMIKMYGAPVKDTVVAAEIVDYLASIKGKK